MQKNPSAALYRNGLQMLRLYQDIFEGHNATGSMAFTFVSTSVGAGMFDDVHSVDEDDSEDESMLRSHFLPSINDHQDQ